MIEWILVVTMYKGGGLSVDHLPSQEVCERIGKQAVNFRVTDQRYDANGNMTFRMTESNGQYFCTDVDRGVKR